MDVNRYVYNADLYCEDCANEIKRRLKKDAEKSLGYEASDPDASEPTYDSGFRVAGTVFKPPTTLWDASGSWSECRERLDTHAAECRELGHAVEDFDHDEVRVKDVGTFLIRQRCYPHGYDTSPEDSDEWPQGVCAGETDTPEHCGNCHCYLATPLTSEGVAYAVAAIADFVRSTAQRGDLRGDEDTLREWASDLKAYNLSGMQQAWVTAFGSLV